MIKMKKIYLGILMLAGVMMHTACSTQDEPAAGDLAVCPIEVTLDGVAMSRSIGDGKNINKLEYAVYTTKTVAGEEVLTLTDVKGTVTEVDNSDGKFNFAVTLVKGQSYKLVFWASNSDCKAYTVDFPNQKVTASYDGAVCNDAGRDAFYAKHGVTVSGAGVVDNPNVTLKRAVAQINFATSDKDISEKLQYIVAKSAMEIKGLSTEFNLATGVALIGSAETNYSFGTAARPTGTIKVNEVEYDWLAFTYAFVNGNVSAKMTVSTDNDSDADITIGEVPNMPVQAGVRTNVIGALLTGGTDVSVTLDTAMGDEIVNL